MNTTDLIQSVAEQNNVSVKLVKQLSQGVFELIKQELAKGESVRISGFGTFSVVRTKDRQLSSAVGGGVSLAHNRAKFKAAKSTREAIN